MRRVYRGFRDRSLSVWLAWALGGGKLPDKTKLKQRKLVRPEDPPDDSGRGPTSPRRTLVFMLLGPVIGALASWSVVALTNGGHADVYGIPPSYLVTLMVCAVTGPVDGVLACVTPIWLRVPLTAIVGAAVAVGVFFFLAALLGFRGFWPPRLLSLLLIVGAIATGLSSLLSHNYRGARV